jgi:hypothetical protein
MFNQMLFFEKECVELDRLHKTTVRANCLVISSAVRLPNHLALIESPAMQSIEILAVRCQCEWSTHQPHVVYDGATLALQAHHKRVGGTENSKKATAIAALDWHLKKICPCHSRKSDRSSRGQDCHAASDSNRLQLGSHSFLR